MSESLWSIYNRAEEVRIDNLQAFHLQALLKSFSPSSFSYWLIWQEGWVDWQELESVVDSLFPTVRKGHSEISLQAKSVPQTQPNSGVIAEQSPFSYSTVKKIPEVPKSPSLELVTSPALTLETPMPDSAAPLKKVERRTYSRVQVPIKLFLHIDGSVIKNETTDISLGGMKLKIPITKEPKNSFDVTMLHQGTELALRCRLLFENGEDAKTRVIIEKCNRMEILRSWIIEPKKESA